MKTTPSASNEQALLPTAPTPPEGPRKRRAKTTPRKHKTRPGRPKISPRMVRLTQPAKREFTVEPLEVDTLRPLVDLAYWSTFLEVRRDAAAAFATLSMNEANLEILSQAGALGALLALVGIGVGRNDSQVHRDAATALAHLVTLDDIKIRLLKAPDGLKALFFMTRSSNVSVKRAAVKAILNLASMEVAKEAIVDTGGLRFLLALTSVKDEKTKRRTALVLKRLSTNAHNKPKMVERGTLAQLLRLLMECADMGVKREVIEVVTNLASVEGNRADIVESGLLLPLVLHLDLAISGLDTVLQVVKCLLLLSSASSASATSATSTSAAAAASASTKGSGGKGSSSGGGSGSAGSSSSSSSSSGGVTQERMAQQGVATALISCVFADMLRNSGTAGGGIGGRGGSGYTPQRINRSATRPSRAGVSATQTANKGKAGAGGGSGGGSSAGGSGSSGRSTPPELEVIRASLSILTNLASRPNNRDLLLDAGLLEHILKDNISCSTDRRTRRPTGRIIALLSDATDVPLAQRVERHQRMVAKGVLQTLLVFLKGSDYSLRAAAAHSLAHISTTDSIKVAIAQAGLLVPLLELSTLMDGAVLLSVAKAIAELSYARENEMRLVEAGVLMPLVRMLAPSCPLAAVRAQACRALSQLSSNKTINRLVVSTGALGFLISLSKSGSGLAKMYAVATLTNLKSDTAALRIQQAYRGYQGRRAYNRRKELQAAHAKLQLQQERAAAQAQQNRAAHKQQQQQKQQQQKKQLKQQPKQKQQSSNNTAAAPTAAAVAAPKPTPPRPPASAAAAPGSVAPTTSFVPTRPTA